MQFGDFFFDGNKRKIYEAPSGFSHTVDGNGYRIYTPDDIPSAPAQLVYSTYELWSRSVDFLESAQWARLVFALDGGAYRYTDQFSEKKYSLIDIRFINDWAYVPANYAHNSYIRGNCFPNEATNIDFDTSRITADGVSPRIFFSDAGERSAEDPEIAAQNTANLRYSSFGGVVSVDVTSETDGIIYPSGNMRFPVNNLDHASEIADNEGFVILSIRGDVSIPTTEVLDGFILEGQNKSLTHIHIPEEASVDDCTYITATISGTLDGESTIKDCKINGLSYISGDIEHCELTSNPIYLGGEEGSEAVFEDCYSGVPGSDTPEVVCSPGVALAMRRQVGGIRISNRVGDEPMSIDMNSGHVIVASSCTGNPIILRGTFKMTVEAGATMPNTEGRSIVEQNADVIADLVGDFELGCP